jgi:hypothetical protein
MSVNKIILTQDFINDRSISIPIQSSWDYEGIDDAIDLYEETAIREVVGFGYDFEVDRFPHAKHQNSQRTDINYEFFFYSGGPMNSSDEWVNSYLGENFSVQDVFYYTNKFTNSFFKLDFYDTIDEKRQKNYFTVILPTQQGEFMNINMARVPVQIRKPKFKLDYVGDKEGFFIYWLKSLEFIPINTFYMTAKFYNAATGKFTKMINRPQSTILSNNKYNFDSLDYFYYKVVLDYIDIQYSVFDLKGNRLGETTTIKWYEYVNPPEQ